MLQALVKTKPSNQKPVGFDQNGKDIDIKSENCFAKSILSEKTGINRYFVLYYNYGTFSGRMYNPLDPTSMPNEHLMKDTHKGLNRCEFKEVSKESFEHYVKFLKTKNSNWLRQAERMLI